MKILIFNWRDIRHPEAGGGEVNIHEQAKRWVEWGHQVNMFTARPKGHKVQDKIDGIEIFRAGGRFTVYLWAIFIYLLVLRKHCDVILDIENGIPFFTPLYSRKPNACLMLHVHQDQFLVEMGPLLGRIGRFSERYLIPIFYRNSKFIAISDSTVKNMRQTFRWASGLKVNVVRPGIDRILYAPDGEEFANPTILYLGRIKSYKRLPSLIAMMPKVREKVPEAELLVAGRGDAMDEAKEEAERCGASRFVRFLGHVSEEEKIGLLMGAWVMATPSMNEGWGMTAIEANACGTPAVAYRVSGLDESISEGQSGLLADSDEEFIAHLISILGDPELRQRLSRGAINWALAFDWDETARDMLAALEESVGVRSSTI